MPLLAAACPAACLLQGHTLQGVKDSWLGAALAVPLCLALGQAIFSHVLTGLLVSLTSMMVVACTALTEPAKKVALIFIIWCVRTDLLLPGRTRRGPDGPRRTL